MGAAYTADRYFYPRPPRGGRRQRLTADVGPPAISIHALREEGDPPVEPKSLIHFYFYPRPPRGGRRRSSFRSRPAAYFYPRPPRGGRPWRPFSASPRRNFYPRPPRGGRHKHALVIKLLKIFLSTPSARRATTSASGARSSRSYFYPRPPRGGRPYQKLLKAIAEGFLSTPSARRATEHSIAYRVTKEISIHALREEGDGLQGCLTPLAG